MVGTPLYMSPEQAEHERPGHRHAQRHLFAGRAALRAAHRHDAVRQGALARARPSTRSAASSARRSRPSRARGSARRATRPRALPPSATRSRPSCAKLVRGELDWIVMKALEKDRTAATKRPTASPRDVAALSGRRAGRGLPAVGWSIASASSPGGTRRDSRFRPPPPQPCCWGLSGWRPATH